MRQLINRNVRWMFPLPAVLFIIVMMAFPVIFTVGISLSDWSMTTGNAPQFVGLKNYIDMFKNQRFYNGIFLTFYLAVLSVSVETILGVAIALMLHRDFIGKNIVKAILLLPMVSTPVAIGLAWTLFYEPTIGLANYALKQLGIPAVEWLSSSTTVIPAIALVDIWEWTPMVILICLAGLAGLPSEPFESARVDGAKPFQVLRHITLPMLYPTILTAITLRSIDAFKTFDIIFTMTGGGPLYSSETLNIYAYKEGFGYFHFGSASSLLMSLFLVVLGCSFVTLRMRKSRSEKL